MSLTPWSPALLTQCSAYLPPDAKRHTPASECLVTLTTGCILRFEHLGLFLPFLFGLVALVGFCRVSLRCGGEILDQRMYDFSGCEILLGLLNRTFPNAIPPRPLLRWRGLGRAELVSMW